MSSLFGQIMFSSSLFLDIFFWEKECFFASFLNNLLFFLFLQTSFLPSPCSLLVSLLWFVFVYEIKKKKNFGFSSPFFFHLFQFVFFIFLFLTHVFSCSIFPSFLVQVFLISSSFFELFWSLFASPIFCFFSFLNQRSPSFLKRLIIFCDSKKKLLILENVFDIFNVFHISFVFNSCLT